jgi:hypothetical protein
MAELTNLRVGISLLNTNDNLQPNRRRLCTITHDIDLSLVIYHKWTATEHRPSNPKKQITMKEAPDQQEWGPSDATETTDLEFP